MASQKTGWDNGAQRSIPRAHIHGPQPPLRVACGVWRWPVLGPWVVSLGPSPGQSCAAHFWKKRRFV
jgi:hypothetical protein